MTAFAAAGDSGTLAASINRPAMGNAGELLDVADQPVRHIDRSRRRNCGARSASVVRGSGLPIAAGKESYILLRQAPSAGKLRIFEQPKAEMGIADRAA